MPHPQTNPQRRWLCQTTSAKRAKRIRRRFPRYIDAHLARSPSSARDADSRFQEGKGVLSRLCLQRKVGDAWRRISRLSVQSARRSSRILLSSRLQSRRSHRDVQHVALMMSQGYPWPRKAEQLWRLGSLHSPRSARPSCATTASTVGSCTQSAVSCASAVALRAILAVGHD